MYLMKMIKNLISIVMDKFIIETIINAYERKNRKKKKKKT